MARTSDTADYMVTQCQACGMLNVIPREYSDGRVCADCSGGPLMPMGYAILQERPTSRITVQVDVERDQLDRLIDDVAAVNETVDGIIQKIGKIKLPVFFDVADRQLRIEKTTHGAHRLWQSCSRYPKSFDTAAPQSYLPYRAGEIPLRP